MLRSLWARVLSWCRHWKVWPLAGKMILEPRAKGLQIKTPPNVSGQSVLTGRRDCKFPR